MLKMQALFRIFAIGILACCAVSALAGEHNFSGVWALERGKTRGLPKAFRNFTMVVTQGDQQIMVESTMDSDVHGPDPNGGSVSGGYLGSVGQGRNAPTGAGTLALSFLNPKLAYPLGGKGTTEQLGAMSNVRAKIKAKLGKDGKSLELSLTEESGISGSSRGDSVTTHALSIKEHWTLLGGGDELKVQRSVAAGQGSDAVTLYFHRSETKPPALQ